MTVADDLRELERRRLRSLVEVDLAAAEELHTPDFELVNPGGSTWSREKYLGGIASGDIDYRRFEPVSDIDVMVDGDLAVLRYRSAIDISVTGGRPARSPPSTSTSTSATRPVGGGCAGPRPPRWSSPPPRLGGMGAIEVEGPPAVLRGAQGGRRGELRGGRGRVLRHPRPQRSRQDDDAGDDRGAAPAGRRAPSACSAAVALAAQPRPLPRIGVQLQASSFFERLTAREQIRTFAALYGVAAGRGGRLAGARRAGRQGGHPGRGPLRRSGRSGCRSPARWSTTRRWSSSTSRPRRSTRRPGATSGTCSPVSTTAAAPSCSPRTTWTRPRRCATGSRSWTAAGCSSSTRPAALVRGLDAPTRITVTPGELTPERAAGLPGVENVQGGADGLVLTTRRPPPSSAGWPSSTSSTGSGCRPGPSRTSSSTSPDASTGHEDASDALRRCRARSCSASSATGRRCSSRSSSR